MNALRASSALALALAVLCHSARIEVDARAHAAGTLTGSLHVVSHPARRLATAGAYPGRIVGIQQARDSSELENVIVFVSSATHVDTAPKRVTIR